MGIYVLHHWLFSLAYIPSQPYQALHSPVPLPLLQAVPLSLIASSYGISWTSRNSHTHLRYCRMQGIMSASWSSEGYWYLEPRKGLTVRRATNWGQRPRWGEQT